MIAFILNQRILVKQNFDITGNLIEYANPGIENSFEYRSVLPAKYLYAINILWQLSPNSFIHFLENLEAEQLSEKNPPLNNVPQSSQSVLIYSMLTHVLKEAVSRNTMADEFLPLGRSEIAYLRAIFIAKTLWFDEAFLTMLIQEKNVDYDYLYNIILLAAEILATKTAAIRTNFAAESANQILAK